MHKRHPIANLSRPFRSEGFSLVELLVVIAVIGVLVSISVVAFISVDKQAKDDKRSADITVFQNELEKYYEKHGEYPPGCPYIICSSALLSDNTSSNLIDSATTVDQLRAILPGINADFYNPTSLSKDTPMHVRTSTDKEYFYYGGTVNNGSSTSFYTYNSTASFPCSIRSSLTAGSAGSYVAGYFNESLNKWMLYGGKSGVQFTITAGSANDGCVINKT